MAKSTCWSQTLLSNMLGKCRASLLLHMSLQSRDPSAQTFIFLSSNEVSHTQTSNHLLEGSDPRARPHTPSRAHFYTNGPLKQPMVTCRGLFVFKMATCQCSAADISSPQGLKWTFLGSIVFVVITMFVCCAELGVRVDGRKLESTVVRTAPV